MNKVKIFCITNIQSEKLENLGLNLVGVGKNKFNKNYITCDSGENINEKEQHYSELTFHYWFWKNEINKYSDDDWIGFCQRRRFWLKSKSEDKNNKLKDIILSEVPEDWSDSNSVICEPIHLGTKFMKVIKRGWRNLLLNPLILLNLKKSTIKLHFDMHHGYGVLDKAIDVLDIKDREDFRNYVDTRTYYNPHIMFIAKKNIMEKYFNNVFPWLFECEKIFGFENLKGYDQTRLYAYLSERYLSFWFKKYTKTIEWPWIFEEIN